MLYQIHVKRVADTAGKVIKDGKLLTFESMEDAREWAHNNLEGDRFICWWEVEEVK
jgi:hypothetical protein